MIRSCVAGAVAVVMFVAAGCGCDEQTETMLVTRRGSSYFRCASAVGDSQPPVCAAEPGTSGNRELKGRSVGDIGRFIDDGRSGLLRLTVRCGEVVGVPSQDV